MRRSYNIFGALACAFGTRCASSPTPASTGIVAEHHSGSVITQEELAGTSAQNALDAIMRLRPNFLASRGATTINASDHGIVVYSNGQRLGGSETLRDIPLQEIKRIEYLNSSDATQRFGTGHSHGAILITRR